MPHEIHLKQTGGGGQGLTISCEEQHKKYVSPSMSADIKEPTARATQDTRHTRNDIWSG